TNGGLNFSPIVQAVPSFVGPGIICEGRYTVKGCIRTDDFPRMAADNGYTSTRGNVYIVYAANPAGPDPDNADIFLVRSTNYGASWSIPIRVNDDATTTDQWMPTISVDKNGTIYIAWYDSRMDPVNNILTRLYGTTSIDGGLTFTANENISNESFNPDAMKVGQGSGQAYYIGDYIGISAIGNTSYAVWMDGRNNSLGSYVGFYPDYAMTVSQGNMNLSNNDSDTALIKIPDTRGPYSSRVKFTVSLDTLPTSGSINFSFINGRDSITTSPDSLLLKISTLGNVNPRLYKAIITGRGINGTPTHSRTVDLFVNTSRLTVGTNRNGIVDFKVNGVTYTNQSSFVFTNGTVVTVEALSPHLSGSSNYIFTHWSNSGDTTQNITVNGNLDLTAYYNVQYKMIMISAYGNTFGGNAFYDSAASFTFGVTTRTVTSGSTTYYFRGWNGSGNGSYTSPDSTGNDSAVTWSMHNPIVETVRWLTTSGISQIGSEIPDIYALYQNYPNPFNPVTKIKYDIVESGNVSIVLYDVLGKEIKNIVNQRHKPGSYVVDFNAENLPSGIYYYRITAKDFVAVKKMILIK
ncbi:MAG: T9SS type A sorting domain-containing protein, partial [Bacteroidetes bacterium]|nr:T9SS type A sorting domain-containing protein [Bacteroidota bacterium]